MLPAASDDDAIADAIAPLAVLMTVWRSSVAGSVGVPSSASSSSFE